MSFKKNKLKTHKEKKLSKKQSILLGCFFLLISFYLAISFISYLFTWQSDQDKLYYPLYDYFFNVNIVVQNKLGKIGALLAHLFIFRWFGISSFIFVIISFLIGIKLFLNIKTFSSKKIIKYTLITLIFGSITLSYLSVKSNPVLGGGIGLLMEQWLESVLGRTGTTLLILFSFFLLILFLFPSVYEKLISYLNFQKNKTKSVELQSINSDKNQNISEDTEKTTVPIKVNEEHNTKSVELDTGINESKDISLDIEKPVENEKILSEKEIKNKILDEQGEYDPTLDLPKYKFPGLDLLNNYGDSDITINQEELENNKNKIIHTLENYDIEITKIKATIGPTVTLYEIVPAPGIRISKIRNLEDDIALSLAALGIRIIAPMPGKGTIGIEVPNRNPGIVSMKTVLASEKFQNSNMELPVALGKTISNQTFVADLSKMPHLLIAGATGQGKSVGLNAILSSLLFKKHPSQIKFLLVDPKKVELTLYNKIANHFLAKLPSSEEPIITDTREVVRTLNSLCREMDNRYELLKKAKVRNLKEYNKKFVNRQLNPEKGHRFLPYIVLVIDEFADLIMTAGKEIETPIARLAQLARAIGIHLIIATQRPSVNIITGTIKANFPTRIAFRVTSKVDSRTILDTNGAEQLVGRGDMLFSTGANTIRLQCAFIDTSEVEKITNFISEQEGYAHPMELPDVSDEEDISLSDIEMEERDSYFEEAARIIVAAQQGSTSLIQRKLKLGYNRAGRIMDQLEAAGIVGPPKGSKPREVLITDEYALEQFLNKKYKK